MGTGTKFFLVVKQRVSGSKVTVGSRGETLVGFFASFSCKGVEYPEGWGLGGDSAQKKMYSSLKWCILVHSKHI